MVDAQKSTTATKTKSPAKTPVAKTPVKKAAAPKSGKTVTVKQIGSPIGRKAVQREYLIGLGLNKMNRVRTLEDTPSVRGMINKAQHMVEIIDQK